MGTLIKKVTDEKILLEVTACSQSAEKYTKEIREKARELKEETERCSCSSTVSQINTCALAPGSACLVMDGSPVCIGEPCNRAELERKKQELRKAIDKFKTGWFPGCLPVISKYIKEAAKLAFAKAVLQEGVNPINYDTFLELKQVIADIKGTVESLPFEVLGQSIRASGHDSMNFYLDLDDEKNQEILDKLGSMVLYWDDYLPPDMELPPPIPGALMWPVPGGTLTQPWGCQTAIGYSTPCPGLGPEWSLHNGIDIDDGSRSQEPAVAAAAGEVIATGTDPGCGYGNWIIVYHSGLNLYTAYTHLATKLVSVGETVFQGQQIGDIDETGFTAGEHLHFIVYPWRPTVENNCFSGISTDPMGYF